MFWLLPKTCLSYEQPVLSTYQDLVTTHPSQSFWTIPYSPCHILRVFFNRKLPISQRPIEVLILLSHWEIGPPSRWGRGRCGGSVIPYFLHIYPLSLILFSDLSLIKYLSLIPYFSIYPLSLIVFQFICYPLYFLSLIPYFFHISFFPYPLSFSTLVHTNNKKNLLWVCIFYQYNEI